MYLYNHSGEKYVAPILDIPADDLTVSYKDSVIDAVYSMYKNKWTRLWELNNAEYNPLENYSMIETHSGSDTKVDTPTNWKETVDHKVSLDYKEVESQKPTNWKETVDHKVSQDYKEVESQKPTNWTETTEHSVSQDYKESDTQVPTNWEKEIEHSVSLDYKEEDTQKPTNWKKTVQTEGTPEVNNNTATVNDVIPFNGTDFAHTTKSTTVEAHKTSEEQAGTYATEHTQTGTKSDTETQSGTFATEHTQTGKKTEEVTQSGTFDTEHTQTGTKTEERSQSGTYDTERTQTGTRTDETTQSGTFESETTYDTELRRSGNIGVTTSQQMAQSEIELWRWLYFEEVFKDIDNILALSTY